MKLLDNLCRIITRKEIDQHFQDIIDSTPPIFTTLNELAEQIKDEEEEVFEYTDDSGHKYVYYPPKEKI